MLLEDILGKAIAERRHPTLYEALRFIEAYGLSVARYRLARSADEAVEAAEELGYPVVLKVSSPDVIHKTEVGGVVVGLKGPKDVRRAYDSIVSALKGRVPGARLEGIVVQEMVEGGYEVIVGGLDDPQFGPVVAVGLGGVYVEVFKDVVFELAPISPREALRSIKMLKAARILEGYRGKPPADLYALAEFVSKVSQLIWDYRGRIKELDLNPTFAMAKGVVAADARVILRF